MITGDVIFVFPSGQGAFGGTNPTPIPPDGPIVPVDCNLSVGSIDGTLYQEPQPWEETCKMFRD